jgi:hypothetical protein
MNACICSRGIPVVAFGDEQNRKLAALGRGSLRTHHRQVQKACDGEKSGQRGTRPE